MIYGISHLTFATGYNNKFINLIKKKYVNKFKSEKISNNKEKIKFLTNKNRYHDISFYEKKNSYNLELVTYRKISSKINEISLNKKVINISVKDLKKEKKFLNLFCDTKNKFFTIKNPLAKSLLFFIKLQKKSTENFYYLDNQGLVSIAFFCSQIINFRNKINKLYFCSKIFKIKINTVSYKVLLVRSKNNIIYEFLQVI
jgi:hypothetical protein